MNIDNGELRRFTSDNFKELFVAKGFVPVPDELQQEAANVLAGEDSATVDLEGNSPLANWVHEERKKRDGHADVTRDKSNKRKSWRRMASTSRARNR